jgi:hypothetical protein
MMESFRFKTMACCVGAALGSLTTTGTLADSATPRGTTTVLGNALNPGLLNTVPARDSEGLDAQAFPRSPTGFLYGWPKLPPETKETESGWLYSGQAELGGLGVFGDTDNAWYLKYKDLESGPYLNDFSFQANQPGTARFFETYGGGIGYSDQFIGAETGRSNDWKLDLFYNEIPHEFTSSYRLLWNGKGSEDLSLGGLTPGGTVDPIATQASIQETLTRVEESDLGLVRKQGGLNVEKYITNDWRVFGGYNLETREGERPFGAVFGGAGGGGNVEIPESIDYETQNFIAGLRFDDGLNNLNLQAEASLFRNRTGTMTFENPLLITPNTIVGIAPTTFTSGRYDLYPDNDYYNILGEYGRSFPDFYNARVTAVGSLAWMKQDDDLIAPTTFSLAGGSINGISTENVWNTPQANSKQSADAEINTRLFSLGLVMSPTDKLDVEGKIRYYETENKTEFFACNPLTGQWGRLLNDGSGGSFVVPNPVPGNNPSGTLPAAYDQAGCNVAAVQALGLVPSAGNVKIRNTPYEYKQMNYVLSGDYDLGRASSLNLTLEREEFDRAYRERDQTWENSLELGYTNRGFSFGTIRVSAEYAERRGDSYRIQADPNAGSAIFGPVPVANGTNVASWIHAPSGLRKFDLADRDQMTLNGRLNVIATEAMDVGLVLQYQNNDYPDSDIGLTDRYRIGSASLDVNYQPSAALGLYGFYTYQQGNMKQSGIQSLSCVIGSYYYFYSDGSIATNTTGIAPPPVNAGVSLRDQARVSGTNWQSLCGDASPINPLYNTERAWSVESDEYNHTFGVGGRYDFGWARVELDYTYTTGVTEIGYSYNPNALGITSPDTLALIGTGMPNLKTTQQFADLNLIVPINKSVAVRALYRYETGSIDDWHYDGVSENPMPTVNTLYLDSGPQDYSTSVVGLFVQVTF